MLVVLLPQATNARVDVALLVYVEMMLKSVTRGPDVAAADVPLLPEFLSVDPLQFHERGPRLVIGGDLRAAVASATFKDGVAVKDQRVPVALPAWLPGVSEQVRELCPVVAHDGGHDAQARLTVVRVVPVAKPGEALVDEHFKYLVALSCEIVVRGHADESVLHGLLSTVALDQQHHVPLFEPVSELVCNPMAGREQGHVQMQVSASLDQRLRQRHIARMKRLSCSRQGHLPTDRFCCLRVLGRAAELRDAFVRRRSVPLLDSLCERLENELHVRLDGIPLWVLGVHTR